MRRLSRRQFLGTAGALIVAGMRPRWGWAQLTQSRVVQVASSEVWQDDQVRPEIVRQMVMRCLVELTQRDSPEEAWQSLVVPDDVVGIKISAEADLRLGTHRAVVDAIVEGLRMAEVPDSQILIWDRMEDDLRRLGYTIQMEKTGIRCYATDKSGPGYDPRVFYDTAEDLEGRRENGSTRSHFSRIVTQDVTRIINVAVLKHHIATGVSLSLKNLAYGSVNNTARFNGNPINGDPAIAEICAHPALRGKAVLHFLDGLLGCFDKGPQYTEEGTWRAGLILASFDPVALDATGLQIIEAKRKEKGLPSIRSKARHIGTAARLGLGTNSADEIELREIELGGEQ